MALVSEELAEIIKEKTNKISDSTALDKLWDAVCEYVASKAEVIYDWAATNPSGTPDPQIIWTGKISTGGSLKQSKIKTPKEALEDLSSQMNEQVNTWTIIPAENFDTEGGTIKITGEGIKISESGAKTRDFALKYLAEQIIKGIKEAVPPVHSGSHNGYIGATTSGKIL